MTRTTSRSKNYPERRIIALGALLGVVFVLALARVALLTTRDQAYYLDLAASQRELDRTLPPERGSVFFVDRFGKRWPAAVNEEASQLYAVPRDVDDARQVADLLSAALEMPAPPMREKLDNPEGTYAMLVPAIDMNKRTAIEALAMKGIHFAPTTVRTYPFREKSAPLLGFYGFNDGVPSGQYGLEEFYDDELRGSEGRVAGERDSLGRIMFSAVSALTPARHGSDLVLTIDPNVQEEIDKIMAATLERWDAPSGGALVLDPNTGRVLAMVSRPTFDANEYQKAPDFGHFANAMVQQRFEPGSVFKPITMAGGLEYHVVTPQTTYTDPGVVTIGRASIRNFDNAAHGVQTMTQVLEKSLNTGVMFAGERLGKEKFLDTIKAFGFGEKTGIDTTGEVSSNISTLETFRDLEFATATFGQGIAVTPIALARAIAAIANGGELVRPFLVERRLGADGREEETKPEVIGRAISSNTAATLTGMLISVVDNGPGYKSAQLPGYSIAAKTGTAQIPGPGGVYLDDVTHTIVGFAPGSAPKFVILLKMDRPQGNRFAANTLTAPLHDVIKFLVEYYEIPPDRTVKP